MSTFTSVFQSLPLRISKKLLFKSKHCVQFLRVINAYSYSSDIPQFVPLYRKALECRDHVAIIDEQGSYTYKDLLHQSIALSQRITKLLESQQGKSTNGRISFLCPSDVSYVIAQWACWISQNAAVPLCKIHPVPQLQYYVEDSQSSLIVTTTDFLDKVEPISKKLSVPILELTHPRKSTDSLHAATDLNAMLPGKSSKENEKLELSDALILYTSGTTGPPKGVVLTHGNVFAQTWIPVDSWEYTRKDVVLNTLPLHHTHGIFYALLSPLYAGACTVMMPKFDPVKVWNHLLYTSDEQPQVNLYTAVPTMYVKLIEEYDHQFSKNPTPKHSPDYIKAVCLQKIRLMASGSAAMPQPVMERWESITGHRILERYGMTEVGLTLSNPLHGERIPGCVGLPVKGTEVCIAKENKSSISGYNIIVRGNYKKNIIAKNQENEIGELCFRGKNVFKEYWNKPKATEESFTTDGWFKTGDTAQYINGVYKILGRTSTDIIKSGGYKISALDVERHLLAHPDIKECVVVGVPDATWGEKVAAVVVNEKGKTVELSELRSWCKERMQPYAAPTLLRCLDQLPRNVLGKVNKKELVKEIFPEAF